MSLSAFASAPPEKRYTDLEALGTGGMGELRGVQDEHLNRLVAMKILREEHANDPEMVARLLKEALVQSQLEHPAIVPVYDAGTFHGRAFFTMKRIRGSTLKEILTEQRRAPRISRRRLLTSFSSALSAVDFAHQRGIVHRDLKPSNLMFGDFDEVYVLDWGVAQALDENALENGVYGTPGYLAPEQLKNEAIDLKSDIFALGSILYEVLTLEKLFGGETAAQRIAATMNSTDVQTRASRHDVPPELARICARAVAADPKERFATVGEMREALEAFLDGDRDLELRRALAEKHALEAAELAEQAIDSDTASLELRKRAMQNVSRALALDQENDVAFSAFVRLLTEPPKEIPDEVRMRVEMAAATSAANVLGGAQWAHIAVLVVFTPLIIWLGVKSWLVLAILIALNVASVLVDASMGRWGTRRGTDLVFCASMLWTASLCAMFGPYFVVPAAAAINVMGYLLVRRGRGAWFAAAIACAAFVVPAVLQWIGVLPPSYVFSREGLTIVPMLADFPEIATHAVLMCASIACVGVTSLIVERFRRALVSAEQRVHVQGWQLRQLLPIGSSRQ